MSILEKEKVLNDLSELFGDILDIETLILKETTTANDIAEWDSVNHLVLLHSIEQKYGIKFSLDEMINFRSVGDICSSIMKKNNH